MAFSNPSSFFDYNLEIIYRYPYLIPQHPPLKRLNPLEIKHSIQFLYETHGETPYISNK